MPTSVDVQNLKINKLTQAQYDYAIANDLIGPYELSMITDTEYATISEPSTPPTLLAANWVSNEQTINVSNVTESSVVMVGSSPLNLEEYVDCGVLCIAQGNGTLTFSCDTVPQNDLAVNVICF